MAIYISSEPAAELLTTAVAKTWLRVDHSSDDTLIDALVKAARKKAEQYTNRAFITQTWDYWLDRIPNRRGEPWWDGMKQMAITELHGESDSITLPTAPIQSVSSVKYYADDDTESTFSSSNYLADIYSAPARVCLNSGATWPTGLRDYNAIKVTFVAGYGDASTDVPEDIILAVREIVAFYYENRGDDKSGLIPTSARALLDPYRLWKL